MQATSKYSPMVKVSFLRKRSVLCAIQRMRTYDVCCTLQYVWVGGWVKHVIQTYLYGTAEHYFILCRYSTLVGVVFVRMYHQLIIIVLISLHLGNDTSDAFFRSSVSSESFVEVYHLAVTQKNEFRQHFRKCAA